MHFQVEYGFVESLQLRHDRGRGGCLFADDDEFIFAEIILCVIGVYLFNEKVLVPFEGGEYLVVAVVGVRRVCDVGDSFSVFW